MELVTVDSPDEPPKNWRMTDAERVRIGRKLKALRIERGLDQIPAAEKAGISVGTLQAIEVPKKHDVRDSNIEKYAQVFGTTVTKLLKPDAVLLPTDPRLDDLNDEHLDVARAYMRAKRRPREAIELLLSHPPAEDALINLLLRLATLPPERVHELDRWVTIAPGLIPLLAQIWHRLLTDPNYVSLVKEGLAVLERQPVPTTTPKTHTTRPGSSSPKRRA